MRKKEGELGSEDLYKLYKYFARDKALDKRTYTALVYQFNKRLAEATVTDGTCILPQCLVKIQLIKFQRSFLSDSDGIRYKVNWGESNKKKQEILNRGGLPLEKWHEDSTGNVYKRPTNKNIRELGLTQKDNGGEPYLSVSTSEYAYSWSLFKVKEEYLDVPKYFRFRPMARFRAAISRNIRERGDPV